MVLSIARLGLVGWCICLDWSLLGQKLLKQTFVWVVLWLIMSVAEVNGASIEVSADQGSVGSQITARLTGGLGNPQDWLGVYRVGAAAAAYGSWIYVPNVTDTWTLTLPASAGTYEIRYYLNNGFTDLRATSPAITVSAAASNLPVVIPGDQLVGNGCGALLGGGAVRLGWCGKTPSLSVTSTFPTSDYGLYRIDVVVRAGLVAGDPAPLINVMLDQTWIDQFTVTSANYTTQSRQIWLRTTDHQLELSYPNTYVQNVNGDYDASQTVDIQSMTLTALAGPSSAAAVVEVLPANELLNQANTVYRLNHSSFFPLYITAQDVTLDCQGNGVYGSVIVRSDNATITNCTLEFVEIFGNHSTIVGNSFTTSPTYYSLYYAGPYYFNNSPTSGHLLSGNQFADPGASDDAALINDVNDMIVSNNAFHHQGDAAVEGLGYWHKIAFINNTFDSNLPIGGWYTDTRSQGFEWNGLTITDNVFHQAGNSLAWGCYPTTLSYHTCDDAAASSGPDYDWLGNPRGIYVGNQLVN